MTYEYQMLLIEERADTEKPRILTPGRFKNTEQTPGRTFLDALNYRTMQGWEVVQIMGIKKVSWRSRNRIFQILVRRERVEQMINHQQDTTHEKDTAAEQEHSANAHS